MAIQPTDFNISISPDIPSAVIGMDKDMYLFFGNTSDIDRGYNLSVGIKLPDGVSYEDSSVSPTSVVENPDGTINISWINVKDLAPGEINYKIRVKLKADELFRLTGLPVSFDIPLESIEFNASIDTLPRGDSDVSNERITKVESKDFIPLRYNLINSVPGKMPKGAGFISPEVEPIWVFQYTLTLKNNSRLDSIVNLTDNLPNGVRYLGGLDITGPDSNVLSSPDIISPTPGPGCQNIVVLDWGVVTLSANSVNTITFNSAIWNNFTQDCIENSGEKIPHGAPLESQASLNGESGIVNDKATIKAMDVTIDKSVGSIITDVGQTNNYSLVYKVNQYDEIDTAVLTDIVSDGQSYNNGSASIVPDSVESKSDGTTEIQWNLGLFTIGLVGTITFNTIVDNIYENGDLVYAKDSLRNDTSISGINQSTINQVSDSSSVVMTIKQPVIFKEILDYYYIDGTIKPISEASPGDEVEFRITYSSEGLAASQKNIEIDEYAPLNMGPLTEDIEVQYTGTLPGPFTPVTVSPNGLRWLLGTIPGDTLWTATFKVPVKAEDFSGFKNNLAKLAGENTNTLGYSDRDQVEVRFAHPDIIFDKSVTGPNINAIKAGEVYTYNIIVANPQNEEGTVAEAFEMDLSDSIPNGLTFTGEYNITGTGVYTEPVFDNQNVSMTIEKLGINQNLELSFDVVVDASIASGTILENNAILQRPYSQPDRFYQYPGDPFVSTDTLESESIQILKEITPLSSKIGDIVTYTLRATVPEGTNAYNVRVIDNYSDTNQSYIVGSATKDGESIIPVVDIGNVVFPEITLVNAISEAIEIVYTFDVRIENGSHLPPYIEEQINTVDVNWDLNSEGTPAIPVIDNKTLEVNTPNLVITKEQRNITKGQSFTTQNVQYDVGDVIEFRILVNNNGAEVAFNSEITDNINSLLSFVEGSITASSGVASETNNTIIWQIPTINVGETETLVFRTDTLSGVSAGDRISNNASGIYFTNNNGFEISYGPVLSNTVRLSAPNVTINKEINKLTAKISDDLLYTITITVPDGTIAYTPEIVDILPIGQEYIGPATRQEPPEIPQIITPIVSDKLIEFPINPDIDATTGIKTIIYTFIARIVNATHNPPYSEIQTNTSRVRWAITEGGQFARQDDAETNITATTPNISIIKEQKNFTQGGSYTTENISVLPEEVVYYKLTVNSNGASSSYNINLDDIISQNETFGEIISGPTVGNVTTPQQPDNILNWNITELESGSIATLEFSVSLNNGLGAGLEISDLVTCTYDSNNTNPVIYNSQSNEVIINLPLLEIEKTSNVEISAIGDLINYTLTITVPNGVNAYNLEIQDELPQGQQYFAGSWFPGTPILEGNTLIYTETTTPITGPQVLEYRFIAQVVSGKIDTPYTEFQTNNVEVKWDLTEIGPQAPIVISSKTIEIATPHVLAIKEQRNATLGGNFTTDPIYNVSTGNIIEYRITLTNSGANTAYNITTTDNLDEALTFLEVIEPAPPGVVESSVPLGTPDGTITWSESSLNVGESLVLTFRTEVNVGLTPGITVYDKTQTTYETSTIYPITLGPEESNEVGLNLVLPKITKIADNQAVILGDRIKYTVEIKVPEGKIIYDAVVSDELPVNQLYVPNSMTRNGISILSPTLDFPNEGTIDASAGEVTITYTFETIAQAISQSPEEIQTNVSILDWNIEEGGPEGPSQSSNIEVSVTNSNMSINKAQRNFTKQGEGDFTTQEISGETGDIIYYELVVANSSTNTIYNVEITDKLDSRLQYNGVIVTPTEGNINYSGDQLGGTLTWSIDSIPPQTSYRTVISNTIFFNSGASNVIFNNTSGVFSAIDVLGARVYGPEQSNIVQLNIPSIMSDEYILGQSDRGQLINIGEELRLDVQLSKNPYLEKSSVIGIVTDTEGNPIEEALVKILDKDYNPLYHGLTNENGNYSIIGITPMSEIYIYATKQGYNIGEFMPISLGPGKVVNADFILEHNVNAIKSTIAGHVTDNSDNPVENLLATLIKNENDEEIIIGTTTTNEFGQYAFAFIDLGNYTVRLTGQGYKTTDVEVIISESSSITKIETKIQIAPSESNGTINGVITDSNGNPIMGGTVVLYQVTGDEEATILTPIRYTKTIDGGAYLFGDVPQGKYIVKANKEE